MAEEYVVYGTAGSGSVPVEATLALLDLPYRVVESTILSEREDAALLKLNPMGQVPALVLPSGELMTESAAILIWLADAHPQAGLAPEVGSPMRPRYLRWMSFISAQVYALFWIRDVPSRLVDGEAAEALVKARTASRIADC